MAARSYLTALPTASPTIGSIPIPLRFSSALRSRNLLRLTIVLLLTWLVTGTTPLSAQRNEGEARGLVGSVAGIIYNLAWPTASYEGFRFRPVQRVSRGYDVPIRLSGESMWGGELWVELVVQLRDGDLHDIRVRDHNAILFPPFQTTISIGQAIAESNQANRRSMLVGTWRDENSVYTFTAGGRWCAEWDNGNEACGSWGLQGTTLTWYFDSGTALHYRLDSISPDAYRTTSFGSGEVWNARRIRTSG